MQVVYIAGPYGATTEEQIKENVRRACILGHLATLRGHAPIVPHAMGFMHCHGDPLEQDGGFTRERALACGTHLAEFVGENGGAIWVIQRDDSSLSEGTRKELDAYCHVAKSNGRHPQVTQLPWAAWDRQYQQVLRELAAKRATP